MIAVVSTGHGFHAEKDAHYQDKHVEEADELVGDAELENEEANGDNDCKDKECCECVSKCVLTFYSWWVFSSPFFYLTKGKYNPSYTKTLNKITGMSYMIWWTHASRTPADENRVVRNGN